MHLGRFESVYNSYWWRFSLRVLGMRKQEMYSSLPSMATKEQFGNWLSSDLWKKYLDKNPPMNQWNLNVIGFEVGPMTDS